MWQYIINVTGRSCNESQVQQVAGKSVRNEGVRGKGVRNAVMGSSCVSCSGVGDMGRNIMESWRSGQAIQVFLEPRFL